jgi:nitrous oxidase accessory protein NosD
MGNGFRATVVASVLVGALFGTSAAWAGGRQSEALWASPTGGQGACTRWAPCSLQNAVADAPSGTTVRALPGVYAGGVQITKPLVLSGWNAVIDASSSPFGNGVQIVGPGGSGSTVEGFEIKNAEFEGILVGTAPVAPATMDGTPIPPADGAAVSDVKILDNVLVNNGTGFGSHAGQCFSTPQAPGDCGETIHLVSVTDSLIEGNVVAHNVGGILMTDEFGPTSGNVVRGNRALGNTHDCGITLAGHNPAAVDSVTGEPTGAAGVFNNIVEDNVADDNGVAGQGAGILLGGGAPYAGVYGNVIRHNVARGNGLAGITIHQHLVGDLNGNVIRGNLVSNDNLDGDFDFAAAAATQTTGILVASGAGPGPALPPPLLPGPITGTVIRHNRIVDVTVGIWTLGVDQASTDISHNRFGSDVTTPVSSN